MRLSKSITTFLLLTIVMSNLYAQKTEKEALAKLSFLMGNWSGKDFVYSKKDTTVVHVKESVNYILDGNIMTIDVNSSTVKLHTIITYSLKDKCYYYQPFSKTGAKKYKGEFKDGKFIVHFNKRSKITFEKTAKGEFHEYGTYLTKDNVWKKYFEDILLPANSKFNHSASNKKITKKYIDPITALTNVIVVDHTDYKTVYIAGQVGTGKTKEMQLETAYKAIEKRLAQAGGSFADLVDMKIYIVDYDPEKDLDMFFRVRKLLYGSMKMPPNVFIGISSLYSKEKKIELSGTAVILN